MAQHDYNIANGGGAAVRADINNALAAIQSANSGATAPTSTKPFMLWFDTTANALKMRNAADTAWDVLTISSSGNLGLGVTPSAWGTTAQTAIQLSAGGALSNRAAGNTDSTVTHGAYYDGTNWRYIYSSTGAARYQMTGANAGSTHSWSVSAGGTAGNAITFTQAMTLDASGNLDIGTTGGVDRYQNIIATSARLTFNAGTGFTGSAATSIYNQSAIAMVFGTNNSERARITSGGNFLVGATSGGSYPSAMQTLSSNSGTTKWDFGPYSTATNFLISSGTGGVQLVGTATSWSALSDERLKTDLEPIQNAAKKVASLRAVTGRYKTDASDVSRAFLIAQDVQAVLPEAVNSSKIFENDDTEYLGLQYTDTIPLLVAAIKEQQAIIEDLRARVAALEAA